MPYRLSVPNSKIANLYASLKTHKNKMRSICLNIREERLWVRLKSYFGCSVKSSINLVERIKHVKVKKKILQTDGLEKWVASFHRWCQTYIGPSKRTIRERLKGHFCDEVHF